MISRVCLISIMALPTPSLLMRKISLLINLETTQKSTEKCIGVNLSEYTYMTKEGMFLEYLLDVQVEITIFFPKKPR